jgi:hypothetical protein
MAVTAKAARGAARKPGGALHGSRFVSTHDGEAQRPWESHGMASWKIQCLIKVGLTRTASMAVQIDGRQIPAAWSAEKK